MSTIYPTDLVVDQIKLIHERAAIRRDEYLVKHGDKLSEDERAVFWQICIFAAINSFLQGDIKPRRAA